MILKTLAAFMVFLIATLPFASATQVNIMFNGNVQQTVDISPSSLVNKQLTIDHDPADITWSRVRVHATINSASLAHTIERIYLFKCKLLNPTQCASVQPITFDSFADTDLLWSDVSEKEGASTYPQTAHIMTLVKLKDDSGQVNWMGFFDRITRTDFNIFTKFSSELPDIDFHVTSFDLVSPAASFMTNTNMLPFAWASKVVFKTSPLYAVGGDARDMDIPALTAASPQGDTITSINKDFFLVDGKTSSGITDFVTLTKNPSFTCGDNICDSNLGESSSVCCIDCGCSLGSYCDTVNPQSGDGVCKVESQIALRVTPPTVPPVTDCTKPITVDVTAQVINPPSSLPSTVSALVTLNNTPQRVSCSVNGDRLSCPTQLPTKISCGASNFMVMGNAIEATLPFNDGKNQKVLDVAGNFTAFGVDFQCGCPTGFFCDIGRFACMADSSLSLSVLEVTSFLSNFDPAGETVHLKVKVNNAPTDLAVTGVTYTLGALFKNSQMQQNQTTGGITCQDEGLQTYGCDIPISIAGYDHNAAYFFKGNKITFSVSYSNVDTTVTRDLVSAFADITIPAFSCGDGVCNVEETQSNCCTDCGCPASGMFCDVNRQACDDLGNIDLQILSVSPTHLVDCTPAQSHAVHLTAQVTSPPSDLNLDFAFYLKNGQVQPYPLVCTKVNPGANAGLFDCTLTLPPFPECQSSPNDLILGPNSLNFSVSFSDGKKGLVTKNLQEQFSDLSITPTFQCGDGICEGILGENGATCCVDCPCTTDPNFGSNFFCDASLLGDAGVCKDKSSIRLVIDNPTTPVSFDSCEKPQKIAIEAHLENAPARLSSTIFSASLNGTNAEFLACRFTSPALDGNISAPIQCSLTVPTITQCSQGKTYVYDPNSLSVTLSFASGRSTQIVSTKAPLPTVQTTQQIRSIFDITRHAFEEMTREIEATARLVDKMLDWIDFCIQMALVLVFVSLAAVIAGGIAGGVNSKDSYTARDGLKDGVEVGKGLVGMWTDICQLINTQYQAQLQASQIRLQIRQSQFCTDIVQHQIDLGADGPCGTGKEQSCFNQLVSCLNFQNIQSAMNQLSGYLDQTKKYSDDFANNLEGALDGVSDFVENYDQIGNSDGVLSIQVNGHALQNGIVACDRAAGPVVTTTGGGSPILGGTPAPVIPQVTCPGGNDDFLNIVIVSGQKCQYPVVTDDSGSVVTDYRPRIDGWAEGQVTYKLYCFRTKEDYLRNSNSLSKDVPGKSVQILRDTNGNDDPTKAGVDTLLPDCTCNQEGADIYSSSSPGGGGDGSNSNLAIKVIGEPYSSWHSSQSDTNHYPKSGFSPTETIYVVGSVKTALTSTPIECKLHFTDGDVSDPTTATYSIPANIGLSTTEKEIAAVDVNDVVNDEGYTNYDEEGSHTIYLQCNIEGKEEKSNTEKIIVDTKDPDTSVTLSKITTDVDGTDIELNLVPDSEHFENIDKCTVNWKDSSDPTPSEFTTQNHVTHHYADNAGNNIEIIYTCTDKAGHTGTATLPAISWDDSGLKE